MISRPTWAKLNGSLIKRGVFVIIGSDGLHPIFGKVEELLVILNTLVLLVHVVKTQRSNHALYCDTMPLIRMDD